MAEVITIDSDEENMDSFLDDLNRAIEESLLAVSSESLGKSSTNTNSFVSSTSANTNTGPSRPLQLQHVETITIDSDNEEEFDVNKIPFYGNKRRVLTPSGVSNRNTTPFRSNQQSNNQPVVTSHPAPVSIVDPVLELTDPHPNIFNLYREFDENYFQSQLATKPIVVEWNNQFTTCAGAFTTVPGIPGSSIKLSSKLLSLVPRAELVNTLLHEMIHAFVFYFHPREPGNYRPHGKFFRLHMNRINRRAGTRITVYHSFHEETRYLNRNKNKSKITKN